MKRLAKDPGVLITASMATQKAVDHILKEEENGK